jgi:hypothetical protein
MSDQGLPDENPGPATPLLWTSERQDLARALRDVDETIGDFYRQIIDSLSVRPRRLADIAIAGHCVRELAAALPKALADVELPPRSDVSQVVQALAAEWDRHRDFVGDAEVPLKSESSGDMGQLSVVSIPRNLLDAARLVVLAHKTGSQNADLQHGALVLGRLDGSDVAVGIFKRSVRFFMRYTHLSGLLGQEVPDDELVQRHLGVVEEALRARLGRFFSTAESIMADLDIANRRKDS